MQRDERGQSRGCSNTSVNPLTMEGQKAPSSIVVAANFVSSPLPLLGAVNRHSVASTTSSYPDNLHFCRICRELEESTDDVDLDSCGRLIAPCLCDGTMKYVHEKCIQHWVEVSQSKKCELCQFEYEAFTHIKPMKEWERCPFFFGLLCNFLIFDTILLLLIALTLWWCAFIVTDHEVYQNIPTMPYGATIPIITMTAPFTAFCLTFGVFSIKYCRKLGNLWCSLNCTSEVREPPEERIARLKLQRQSQRHGGDILTAVI